jgi:hypothetical protein
MSDRQSVSSGNTTTSKHGVCKIKICGYCGKAEGPHYAKHNKEKHPGQEPLILNPDEEPKETPWCTNWKEIATNPNPDVKIDPIGKLSNFKRGVGSIKGTANRS